MRVAGEWPTAVIDWEKQRWGGPAITTERGDIGRTRGPGSTSGRNVIGNPAVENAFGKSKAAAPGISQPRHEDLARVASEWGEKKRLKSSASA